MDPEATGFVDFLHWKKPGESFNPIQTLLNCCGCFTAPQPGFPDKGE